MAVIGGIGALVFILMAIFLVINLIIYLAQHKNINHQMMNRRIFKIVIVTLAGFILMIAGFAFSGDSSSSDTSHHISKSGYITNKKYRSIHEGQSEKTIKNKLGKPYSKDSVADIWTYKLSDKPHKGKKVLVFFDKKAVLDKETQAEFDANANDDNDNPNTDSDSSTNNISLGKAKTTSQLMEAAAVTDPDNFKKASVRDGIAVIELKDSGEWDEKTTVQNFALRATDFLKGERNNPNFKAFAFIRKAKFEDEKGNEKTETAILAYFTKKNAQSINYSNFTQNVDLDPYKFYDISDGYFIHPAIYKKVESSFHGLPAYKNSKDRKVSDDFYNEISAGY